MFDEDELPALRAEWVREFARQDIEILKPIRGQDPTGAPKTNYRKSGMVRGRLMSSDTAGQQTQVGQKPTAVDTWEIRLPWGTEIKPIYRFRFGGWVYAVQTLDDTRAEALFLSVFCTRSK